MGRRGRYLLERVCATPLRPIVMTPLKVQRRWRRRKAKSPLSIHPPGSGHIRVRGCFAVLEYPRLFSMGSSRFQCISAPSDPRLGTARVSPPRSISYHLYISPTSRPPTAAQTPTQLPPPSHPIRFSGKSPRPMELRTPRSIRGKEGVVITPIGRAEKGRCSFPRDGPRPTPTQPTAPARD